MRSSVCDNAGFSESDNTYRYALYVQLIRNPIILIITGTVFDPKVPPLHYYEPRIITCDSLQEFLQTAHTTSARTRRRTTTHTGRAAGWACRAGCRGHPGGRWDGPAGRAGASWAGRWLGCPGGLPRAPCGADKTSRAVFRRFGL